MFISVGRNLPIVSNVDEILKVGGRVISSVIACVGDERDDGIWSGEMERLVKKFEQRYRRALDHHTTWDALQIRLLKQFGNAAAILDRLPVLRDPKKYGILEELKSMTQGLPAVQIESLELILRSMQSTLGEMEALCKLFEKLWRDGCQLLINEKPTVQQLQQRVGSRPSLNDCVEGLHTLYIMHRDEHLLKVAILSALSYNSRCRSVDVAALQTVLADQPNLPPDEVRQIFEVIAAGDVW